MAIKTGRGIATNYNVRNRHNALKGLYQMEKYSILIYDHCDCCKNQSLKHYRHFSPCPIHQKDKFDYFKNENTKLFSLLGNLFHNEFFNIKNIDPKSENAPHFRARLADQKRLMALKNKIDQEKIILITGSTPPAVKDEIMAIKEKMDRNKPELTIIPIEIRYSE